MLVEAKLFSKSEILDYYNMNGSFLGMKRCGIKINQILAEICEEWINCV